MDWIQILSLFLANAALIFWFRSESRADWRHMDAKMDAFNNKMDAYREDSQKEIHAIHLEMKDFHSKLCEIEMNRR